MLIADPGRDHDCSSMWGAALQSPYDQLMNRLVRIPAALTLAAALAMTSACGPVPGSSGSRDFLCGSVPVTEAMLEQPTRIADLDAESRSAIEDATFDDGRPLQLDDSEDWQVIVDESDEIVLIRPVDAGELPIGDFGDGLQTDHELLMLTTDLWPGWAVAAQTSCALTVDLGELVAPFVALDSASPPSPDSQSLSLLVLDSNCGGATDMPERIEVVSVIETDDEVRVLLGVRPLPGGTYTCEGFPPTPFSLELEQPLGDRSIIDASRAVHTELVL